MAVVVVVAGVVVGVVAGVVHMHMGIDCRRAVLLECRSPAVCTRTAVSSWAASTASLLSLCTALSPPPTYH